MWARSVFATVLFWTKRRFLQIEPQFKIKIEDGFQKVIFTVMGKTNTVVGDNINIMRTTFELNFDFYKAFKIKDTQKYGNKEKLSI